MALFGLPFAAIGVVTLHNLRVETDERTLTTAIG
jgi:hypothetical protein